MRRHWLLIAAIALLGLGLRIAAAQGGLWLDEAWSALYARDAGTPLAVFLNINHDNNHHLNTLWLQMVGHDAAPMLQRGLSIVTGTAAIFVAALVGERRGTATAVVTALLFAVCPLLVTYGSEARGYAPMILALLAVLLIVDRWIADPGHRLPALGLAVTVLLGMLAQLTLVFGLAAIAGWAVVTLFRSFPRREAMRYVLRLLAPLTLPAAAVVAVVLGAAGSSPNGFRMGNYDPFSFAKFHEGTTGLLAYTFAIPRLAAAWLAPLAAAFVAAAAIFWPPRPPRLLFYALAILAFPAAVVVLQLPNSGFPRYYLLVAVAALLLTAERIGEARGKSGWAAGALLAVLVTASLGKDIDVVRDRRGDTSAAIAAMARLMPQGATIGYGHERSAAVIGIAAAQMRYPARSQQPSCPSPASPPPDLLYVDTDVGAPVPNAVADCGQLYFPVARGWAKELSGMNWTLLARRP